MKFTDRFFEMPVRIYDEFTVKKAKEEERSVDIPMEGDWVAGKARIAYQDIVFWSDYYDSIQGAEGVKQQGFQYTLVYVVSGESFICTWTKAKFEARLDEHAKALEEWIMSKGEELNSRTSTTN